MDADLKELMDGGVDDIIIAWADKVTVQLIPSGNLELTGVQSNTTVEQQVMLAGMGFEAKRTYSLLIKDRGVLATLKQGMVAVDVQGESARFCHYEVDPHGVLLFFELK